MKLAEQLYRSLYRCSNLGFELVLERIELLLLIDLPVMRTIVFCEVIVIEFPGLVAEEQLEEYFK